MKLPTFRKPAFSLVTGSLCALLLALPSRAQYTNTAQNLDAAILPLSGGGGLATGATVPVNGIPVNLYQGTASPTFTLTTLQGKDITVPITLGYDGQGVRVNSVAGEVGTGWGLAAGGEIACDVQDEPDETRGRSIDWLRVLQSKPGGNGLERVYQEYVCRYGVKEYDDTEYDIFHLNANGIQARFLVKDGLVFVLDNPAVRITPTFAYGSQYKVISFFVIDNTGTKYLFTDTETTTNQTVSSRVGSTRTPLTHTSSYTSRWMLNSIESANHEIVTFNYYQGSSFSYASTNTSDYQALTLNGSAYSDGVATYTNVTTTTVTNPRKLFQINSPAGSIQFTRNLTRKDISDNALTGISTVSIANQVLTQTKFSYSYFLSPGETNPTPQNSRLRLDKIAQVTENCAAEVTKFDYFQIGDVSRQSLRQDYYGYYNNNTATTLLPPVPGQGQLTSGNRNADASQIINCALKQITYPTGAAIALEYGLHLPTNADVQYAGGGLRINKITSSDGNGHSLTEELSYDQTNNGITPLCYDFRDFRINNDCNNLDQSAAYDYYRCVFRSSSPIASQAGDRFGYPSVTVKHPNQSTSVYTFNAYNSNQDTWNGNSTKVQVYIYDRTPNGGGDLDGNPCFNGAWVPTPCNNGSYNVDQQSFFVRGMYPQLAITERPYGVLNDNSAYRGVLLSQQDYAANGTAVRSVTNQYSFPTFSYDPGAVSARIGYEQDYSGGGSYIYSYYYNVKFFIHAQAWARLDKQTITVYDQNSAAFSTAYGSTSLVTDYAYDADQSNASYQPRTITTYSSGAPGKTKVVCIRRANEFQGYDSNGNFVAAPGTFIEQLIARNMLSIPVEQYTYFTDNSTPTTVTESVFSQYRVENDRLLPDQVFSWQACGNNTCAFTPASATQQTSGSWSLTKDANYQLASSATRYDATGNVLTIETKDGLSKAQIWGYANTLPIAQVTNAAAGTYDTSLSATTGHTSFEFDESSDAGSWGTPSQYSSEAKTGNRSVALSSPNAIYGPGREFAFMPDKQHGKWIFSCWAKVPASSSNTSSFNLVVVVKDINDNDLKWTGPNFSAVAGQQWIKCTNVLDFEDPSIRSVIPANQPIRLACYVWLSGGQPLLIDEYRAQPSQARMITQTYIPGIGKSSETDANDVTLYYEYGDDHRLSIVKDENGNIIKRQAYHSAQSAQDITLSAYATSSSSFMANQPNYFVADALECIAPTYYWNFGDGSTTVGTSSPSHSYAQAGTYTVTVVASGDGRAPLQQSFSITITQVLSVDANVDSGSLYADICDYPPAVSLSAAPSGGCAGSYTYQWQSKPSSSSYWSDLSGETSSTLTVEHNIVGSFDYQCVVTDQCGNQAVTYTLTVTTDRSYNCPI